MTRKLATILDDILDREGWPTYTEPSEDYPDRDDEKWMKHTLAWLDEGGKVRLGDRPVHSYTLTDQIEYIQPKARVY